MFISMRWSFALPERLQNVTGPSFGQTASEFTQRLQVALHEELAAQRRAGYAIYGLYESDRVYTVRPDACCIAGRLLPDETTATNPAR
jgi:hypothetical protein